MGHKTGFISDDLAATVVPTAPTDLVVGRPCSVGNVPAVVAEAVDEDGAVVARFRGMFRMPVADTGGVAPGDKIWFNATDNSLSKTGAGAIQFGYAMESIADGDGVTDILVLLRGGNTSSTVPSVPTGLAASSIAATSLNLFWAMPTDDFGDNNLIPEGQYKATADTLWIDLTILAVGIDRDDGSVFVTVTGLTASTSYDFRARVRNSAGASDWTATVMATTIA